MTCFHYFLMSLQSLKKCKNYKWRFLHSVSLFFWLSPGSRISGRFGRYGRLGIGQAVTGQAEITTRKTKTTTDIFTRIFEAKFLFIFDYNIWYTGFHWKRLSAKWNYIYFDKMKVISPWDMTETNLRNEILSGKNQTRQKFSRVTNKNQKKFLDWYYILYRVLFSLMIYFFGK